MGVRPRFCPRSFHGFKHCVSHARSRGAVGVSQQGPGFNGEERRKDFVLFRRLVQIIVWWPRGLRDHGRVVGVGEDQGRNQGQKGWAGSRRICKRQGILSMPYEYMGCEDKGLRTVDFDIMTAIKARPRR